MRDEGVPTERAGSMASTAVGNGLREARRATVRRPSFTACSRNAASTRVAARAAGGVDGQQPRRAIRAVSSDADGARRGPAVGRYRGDHDRQ